MNMMNVKRDDHLKTSCPVYYFRKIPSHCTNISCIKYFKVASRVKECDNHTDTSVSTKFVTNIFFGITG